MREVPRLSINHLSKTFGSVSVLSDVALEITRGEVHGLVGQNGSGKSTLIKILSGLYRPDAGAQVSVDGRPLRMPAHPLELRELGLAFVHQDLGLDLSASVIENVRVGRFHRARFTQHISWQREADATVAALGRLGRFAINPYSLAGSLNHAERAAVAIARALQDAAPGRGCIVFDESTQSLPRDVLEEFRSLVQEIAATGVSVLLVSHRLDEVLTMCDRVTVLEDGRVTIGGLPTAGLSEAELGRRIMGADGTRELGGTLRTRGRVDEAGTPAMSARGLSGHDLRGVDFDVHHGEVLGVIGDPDSGIDELPGLLSGSGAGGGTIAVGGSSVVLGRDNVRRLAAAGVALVPSGRATEGLSLSLPATDNVSLPRLRGRGRPWFVGRSWQLEEFRASVGRLSVTPAAPWLPAAAYSGGNQQKLLLAKWLLNEPKLLIAHEPTQAVDVGARDDILGALRAVADDGAAVVMVSIEADDLARVCDRILVLHRGRVIETLTGDDIDSHRIMTATYDQKDVP